MTRPFAVAVLVACVVLAGCSGPASAIGGRAPSGPAADVLASLTVRAKGSMSGYARDRFGRPWALDEDHSGCDTREDVLARDMTSVKRSGCKVLTGTLKDPYTGKKINFHRGPRTSAAVQIDHRVPEADAWRSGASAWSDGQREQLSNDGLELVAVDGPTNGSKGDQDASTWLPPDRGYACGYVAGQIAVKAKYRLSVSRAEHDAMARVLAGCPGQRVPT